MKKQDTRAQALAAMTKAELVKTIKTLDRRQTSLLNRIEKLENIATNARALVDAVEARGPDAVARLQQMAVLDKQPPFKDGLPTQPDPFPWELK